MAESNHHEPNWPEIVKQSVVKIRELKARITELEANTSPTDDTPIAIVGMGCRFPGGANDAASYWKLLEDGVDAVIRVPEGRWSRSPEYETHPGSTWGGFLDRDAVEGF